MRTIALWLLILETGYRYIVPIGLICVKGGREANGRRERDFGIQVREDYRRGRRIAIVAAVAAAVAPI